MTAEVEHDWLRRAQSSITLKRVVNGKRCVPYTCLPACSTAAKVFHSCLLWVSFRMVPQFCLRVILSVASFRLPPLTSSNDSALGPITPSSMAGLFCCCFRDKNLLLAVINPAFNTQTWRANGSLFLRPLPFKLSGLGSLTRRRIFCQHISQGH